MKNTFLRAIVAISTVIASAASTAQSFDSVAWLNQSLARVTADAAGWQVSTPVVQLTDEDYFMVAPNGTVLVGRRFLSKLAEEKDRDDILRFVLLHEFRHIHQLKKKAGESRAALECEADYHAAFRLASTTLDAAPDSDATIGKVISFQSIGPRLNRIADTAGHGHLTSRQRFLAGSFGVWRALHLWMARKGKLDEPRYAELAMRARSFTQPASSDDSAWASAFCGAMVPGANSERDKIDFRPKGSELSEEGARTLFKDSYELRNKAQWPLRVTGWQVIGIHNKDREDDFSLYMAGQANAIDMVLQPGEAKSLTWLKMFPRTSSSTTIFDWGLLFMPDSMLNAVRAGPRLEQPNCQASWTTPADKSLAELFDFMLRTGNSVSRQFVGVRGEPRAGQVLPSMTIYDFAEVPARAEKSQSFIVTKKGGGDMWASIRLADTEALGEAERVFNEIADAFVGACGAKVLERARDENGNLQLRVKRLTPLSSATMLVSKSDARDSGKTRYTVRWDVQSADE